MHQMDNPPTILNASHICFQSFPGSPQDATHPPASRPPRPAPHLRVQEEAEAKAVKGKEAGREETGKETCATSQAWEETIWRWRWKAKASCHQLCKVSVSFRIASHLSLIQGGQQNLLVALVGGIWLGENKSSQNS